MDTVPAPHRGGVPDAWAQGGEGMLRIQPTRAIGSSDEDWLGGAYG